MYRKREQNLLSCLLLSTAIVWPPTSPAWFRVQEPLCKTAEALLLLYPAPHRQMLYLTTLLIVKLYTASVVCEWIVSMGLWWKDTDRLRQKYLEKQICPSASFYIINFYWSNLGLGGERPAAKSLPYGKGSQLLLFWKYLRENYNDTLLVRCCVLWNH